MTSNGPDARRLFEGTDALAGEGQGPGGHRAVPPPAPVAAGWAAARRYRGGGSGTEESIDLGPTVLQGVFLTTC